MNKEKCNSEKRKGKIVVAFTCSGKTWVNENQDRLGIKAIDLMERDFAFLNYEKNIRNPEYPENILYEIENIKDKYDLITLTFSKTKCDLLEQYNVEFILVGPSEEEYDKWEKRLRNRGASRGFGLWDRIIREETYKEACIIKLKANEYLSDKLGEILR